ncbi:hypothetical protein MKX42_30125 [Paenibacillus sp. FSL R7-0204]|uniref:hypothetical protein n=1 Tax=Paenibacillus sp. FSL R7-0204 TaxID=2921675 RepID=UPI0030F4BA4B
MGGQPPAAPFNQQVDKRILIYRFPGIVRKQVDKQQLILGIVPISLNSDPLSIIYPTTVPVVLIRSAASV